VRARRNHPTDSGRSLSDSPAPRPPPPPLQVRAGDSALSLLPPWHIYERTVGYHLFRAGARLVFTSIKRFRDDLTAHPPDHFVCVPLVLDTLYTKVGVLLWAMGWHGGQPIACTLCCL
jgi:hypothetical protein